MNTQTETQWQAEHAVEQASDLAEAFGGFIPAQVREDYGLDESADEYDLLEVMVLEIYGTAKVGPHRDGRPESITVVTGIGGPHVEFTVDFNDNVTGVAYWGGERAERHDHIPELFDNLLPLVVVE